MRPARARLCRRAALHVFTARALAGPIKAPFRALLVLGNLAREEARTFFLEYVVPFRKLPPGAAEAWARVYEVCGGNPQLLRMCAGEAAAYGSWELGALRAGPPCAACVRLYGTAADRAVLAGCNAIVQGAMADISNGLRPATIWKGAAWSAADLRAVLRSIVSSPHAAVPVADLAAMLGAGGAAKLASMNGRDLLVLRAFDPLARDIDAAAFGPGLDEDVYTLPSAAHVLAARIELDV